ANRLGIVNDIFDVPMVFDSEAARSIRDQQGTPYIGFFRPELGNLTDFNGLTGADVTGDWTLTLTDNHNGNVGHLDAWGLQINSGMTDNGDVQVATPTVLGAASPGSFPLKPALAPDLGIGPAAVIASDNTLGSFSPYQGRLYVAYVDRSTASGN